MLNGGAPAIGSTDFIAGNNNGSSIVWDTATNVERVLVGQTMAGIGSFGYERLANGTPAEEISTFDLTQATGLDAMTGTDPFSPALGAIAFGASLPAIP